MNPDITCRAFVDFLMRYLDGELPKSQSRVFEEHTSACPPCQVYLDSYRDAVRMGKEVCRSDDEGVPDDVPEALLQAILAARRENGS